MKTHRHHRIAATSLFIIGLCSIAPMTTSCGRHGDAAVMTQCKEISADCPENMDIIGILDSVDYQEATNTVTLYFTEEIKGFCDWLKKSEANRASCVKYFLSDVDPQTFAKAISTANAKLTFTYPATGYSFDAGEKEIADCAITPMTKFDMAKMSLNLTAEVITLNASKQPGHPSKAEMTDRGFTVYYNTTPAALAQMAADNAWAKKNTHAKIWNSRNEDAIQSFIQEITTLGMPLDIIYQSDDASKTATVTFTAKELQAFLTD